MYVVNLLGIYSVTSAGLGAESQVDNRAFLGALAAESLQVPLVFGFII